MKSLIVVFLFLMGGAAFAADIDFSAVITDQDGAPLMDCNTPNCNGPPLTLGHIAMRAATAVFDDDRGISGEEKFKRGELAMRVYKGGKMSLSAEDVALLKKLIAKGYGPMMVLKAWSLLDPGVATTSHGIVSAPQSAAPQDGGPTLRPGWAGGK